MLSAGSILKVIVLITFFWVNHGNYMVTIKGKSSPLMAWIQVRELFLNLPRILDALEKCRRTLATTHWMMTLKRGAPEIMAAMSGAFGVDANMRGESAGAPAFWISNLVSGFQDVPTVSFMFHPTAWIYAHYSPHTTSQRKILLGLKISSDVCDCNEE